MTGKALRAIDYRRGQRVVVFFNDGRPSQVSRIEDICGLVDQLKVRHAGGKWEWVYASMVRLPAGDE